jgi:drug/metabolite transporter (DMT)-like permease
MSAIDRRFATLTERTATRVRRTARPVRRLAAGARSLNAGPKAYIALAIGIVCIGFSAIFTKWAHVEGPVSGFYRVAIATVVLAIPYGLQAARGHVSGQGRRGLSRIAFGLAALAGLFFALDLGFWNTSLLLTSAANSTLLGNTSTLWVSIGATLFFHEQLRRRFWGGMLLALVGAAIVVGRDVFVHPTLGWGDLLALGSGLFYAGYLLDTQRARRYLGTLPFMWLSSAVATILLLAYTLAAGFALTGYSTNTYLSLLALGLISHVLGWLAINYALGHLPAPLTAVTLLSQPVITALIAVPLLGEQLSFYQIGGGLLVLLGVYVVNRR